MAPTRHAGFQRELPISFSTFHHNSVFLVQASHHPRQLDPFPQFFLPKTVLNCPSSQYLRKISLNCIINYYFGGAFPLKFSLASVSIHLSIFLISIKPVELVFILSTERPKVTNSLENQSIQIKILPVSSIHHSYDQCMLPSLSKLSPEYIVTRQYIPPSGHHLTPVRRLSNLGPSWHHHYFFSTFCQWCPSKGKSPGVHYITYILTVLQVFALRNSQFRPRHWYSSSLRTLKYHTNQALLNMSTPKRHKKKKSDNTSKQDPGDGEKDTVGPLPQIPGTSAPSPGTPDQATTETVPDSASDLNERNWLKRKASSLLTFSKATSIHSFDPHVEEWKQKLDQKLLAYACHHAGDKHPELLEPEVAQSHLEDEYSSLSWSGPSLSSIYRTDQNSRLLKSARSHIKGFIQMVLSIGLVELESPFSPELVKILLDKQKPHVNFDAKKSGIDDETVYETVGLFQEKRYWTGICTLFPQLEYPESTAESRDLKSQWKVASQDAKAEWARDFVDRKILIAIFSRMLRSPAIEDKIRLYAKVLAIVQSSGTGKSRLLKELVNYIPGMYLNLANSDYVLPARDKAVLDFVKRSDMPTTRFICLFDAIFTLSKFNDIYPPVYSILLRFENQVLIEGKVLIKWRRFTKPQKLELTVSKQPNSTRELFKSSWTQLEAMAGKSECTFQSIRNHDVGLWTRSSKRPKSILKS